MSAPGPQHPRISDYTVEPESGMEMRHGEVREALPAGPLHSVQHTQVASVARAAVAPGYCADTDLLTRQAAEENFASDTCIRRIGIDPATGERYLEELAFEIKSTQSDKDLAERARIMARRGVRRIFAISVRGDAAASEIQAGPVREWQAAMDTWRVLGKDELIHDPCLRGPLPVQALLEAAAADRVVARACIDKGIDVIQEYGADRYRDGLRRALLLLLEARGLSLDQADRIRITGCPDTAVLERWLARAASAVAVRDIF